jgi:hypothetical protein
MIFLVIIPALVSLLLSIGLLFSDIPHSLFYSLYVGLWVPTILSFGTLILLAGNNGDKK